MTGVALDSAGNLYAAGWTEALNFPSSWPRSIPGGSAFERLHSDEPHRRAALRHLINSAQAATAPQRS